MPNLTTKRKLHYYNIKYKPSSKNALGYKEVFKKIISLNENIAKERIFKDPYGTILMHDVKFGKSTNYIVGKLLRVRNDIFPQLIDMTNDQIKDLEANEQEGLVETTHFLVDHSSESSSQICMEYNHFGPRFGHFQEYIRRIGLGYKLISGLSYELIVQNRLEQIVNRMERCSSMSVRVHESNIQEVIDQNQGLGSALLSAQQLSGSDQIEMTFKLDYKTKNRTSKINTVINDFIKIFSKNPNALGAWDKFQVRAEDSAKNSQIELFDLLLDKEYSEITVQKRTQSRTVVSLDILKKMRHEYERKFG
ncbi:MAG: hypothetical protein JXR10_17565 [Cyclobacteriaceae bacterium]